MSRIVIAIVAVLGFASAAHAKAGNVFQSPCLTHFHAAGCDAARPPRK